MVLPILTADTVCLVLLLSGFPVWTRRAAGVLMMQLRDATHVGNSTSAFPVAADCILFVSRNFAGAGVMLRLLYTCAQQD